MKLAKSDINGKNTGAFPIISNFFGKNVSIEISFTNDRCMVELAVKGLENNLKEYEKSPETHPLYPEEWKLFWNRRYKELQAGSYRLNAE